VTIVQLRVRSFQSKLPELESRGIHVVAVSVDSPEINRRQRQKLGYTYTFLSDPKAEVNRRYICCIAAQDPKGLILRARQNFSLIRAQQFAG
jgi:peroxiredoxin